MAKPAPKKKKAPTPARMKPKGKKRTTTIPIGEVLPNTVKMQIPGYSQPVSLESVPENADLVTKSQINRRNKKAILKHMSRARKDFYKSGGQ
jgi:hypothetical protein